MSSRFFKRYELKYYITRPEYIVMRNLLSKVLPFDKHSEKGPYFVRSLYFDNVMNRAYLEKIRGLLSRSKYRMRIYDLDDHNVKFEIKNKSNDQILKETVIISRKDAKEVIKGNLDVLLKYKNNILNKIYAQFKKDYYRPVTMVDYKRMAFSFPLNNFRITFDEELSFSETHSDIFSEPKDKRSIRNNNLVIMEIKFNKGIPEEVKDILQVHSFFRSAISKFCMSRTID
ncbi:polyphosphate polymerase domain-containing protein [Nanoarchaeota archaeon]